MTDPPRCPEGALLYGKELGAGMKPQPQSAEWRGARPESGVLGQGHREVDPCLRKGGGWGRVRRCDALCPPAGIAW